MIGARASTAPHRRAAAVRGRLANVPRLGDARAFGRALRSPYRVSAFRAVVDGVVVTIVLRRRGVRPLIPPSGAGDVEVDVGRAVTVATVVDAALGILPLSATCLRRSLVLLRELRRLGLAGTLHVGVRRLDDRSEAHAWLQVADVVVNDDPERVGRYRPFPAGAVEQLLPMLP